MRKQPDWLSRSLDGLSAAYENVHPPPFSLFVVLSRSPFEALQAFGADAFRLLALVNRLDASADVLLLPVELRAQLVDGGLQRPLPLMSLNSSYRCNSCSAVHLVTRAIEHLRPQTSDINLSAAEFLHCQLVVVGEHHRCMEL